MIILEIKSEESIAAEIFVRNEDDITEVCGLILNGEVGILETDTVCGVVCNAYNKISAEKIMKVKRREKNKIFSLFVGSVEEVEKLCQIEYDFQMQKIK